MHIPWCVRKCPYCDFNSHEPKKTIPERDYINALIQDLEQSLPSVWGRTVDTIFIGGGTPSLFSAEGIDRLLSEIRARLPLAPTIEITMEANPGAIEQAKFAEFRSAGINRLSIGVQSLNDELLQRIGRVHSAREAYLAVEHAHDAGFEQINLDLMFALPTQTLVQAQQDLSNALALEPTHLSHYQMTIEPNTWFHKHPPATPDDELSWAMQSQCQERLGAAGFEHYEVSAYARPGKQCRHNLNYWQYGDYLGIGAGAHAKITDAAQQNITRTATVKHPNDYLQHAASEQRYATQEVLSRKEVPFEFMMNALRLTEGFPSSLFFEHTGLPLSTIDNALQQAEEQGLLEYELQWIRPTEQGRRFLNTLLTLFLPPS